MTKPTRKEVGLAMCHECMGYWQDGKMDCENVKCPQYYYQPYRKLEPNLEWMKYNPARKGLVTWEDSKIEFSEEHLEVLREKMGEVREGRIKRTPI